MKKRDRTPVVLAICAMVAFVAIGDTGRSIASSQGDGAAKACETDDRMHDFGTIISGDSIEHVFRISNTSSKTLTIQRVLPSCSCVQVGSTCPTEIPPQSVGEFPVKIDTARLSGEFHVKIVVQLESEEPIICIVKGDIIPAYPESICLGRFKRGESSEKIIVIRSRDPQFKIVDMKYDRASLTVSRVPEQDGEGGFVLSVIPCETLSLGALVSELVIRTTDAEQPDKVVRIEGYVLQDVEADPDRVFLGTLKENERRVKSIRLYSPYGHKVTIIESKMSANFISCDVIDKEGDGLSQDIDLTINGVPETKGNYVAEEVSFLVEANKSKRWIRIAVFALK